MKSNFDVLVPAHGESVGQVERLLDRINHQETKHFKLANLLLCSDQEQIEERFGNRSSLVFIHQEPRRGKPDALNKMLEESDSDFCIQNSADCVPASELTYDFLLRPLKKALIGAVTPRIVPVNMGFMGLPNIVWKCHDFVQPKLSAELFSFRRNLVDHIPEEIIHDDTFIHKLIISKGYEVLFEPNAIVLNAVPETMTEYYAQRKKNVVGNLQYGHLYNDLPPDKMRFRSLALMGIELLANLHGRLDYARGKIPLGLVGHNLPTTKEVKV